MQKYCLTSCFKRNISKKAEVAIEVIVAILTVLVVAAAITVLATILGVALQFAVLAYNPATGIFADNPIILGSGAIAGILLLGSVAVIAVNVLSTVTRATYKFTKNLALNVVAPQDAECRIFEPCNG